MSKLLLSLEWLSRLSQHSRIVVAFSGGKDSTALLHAVTEQCQKKVPVVAIHVNHGLQDKAMQWERHCRVVCGRLGVPLIVKAVQISPLSNLESRARNARYTAIKASLQVGDAVLMAHHANDQVETLLLNLLRGCGVDGLASTPEVATFGVGVLYRPLLKCHAKAIIAYVDTHSLNYIEDDSNGDVRFNRNYLRQSVLPLLYARWPSLPDAVVRTVEHCQQAKRNLEHLAFLDGALKENYPQALSIDALELLPMDRQINVFRVWYQRHGLQAPSTKTVHRIFKEVILARLDAQPLVEVGERIVVRYERLLYVLSKAQMRNGVDQRWEAFPKPLWLAHLQQWLKIENPPANGKRAFIYVRYRRGGERIYWRGHRRSLKKLFQSWGIPPWERARLPLVYMGEVLIAVPPYAVSDVVSEHCCFRLG